MAENALARAEIQEVRIRLGYMGKKAFLNWLLDGKPLGGRDIEKRFKRYEAKIYPDAAGRELARKTRNRTIKVFNEARPFPVPLYLVPGEWKDATFEPFSWTSSMNEKNAKCSALLDVGVPWEVVHGKRERHVVAGEVILGPSKDALFASMGIHIAERHDYTDRVNGKYFRYTFYHYEGYMVNVPARKGTRYYYHTCG